MTTETKKVTPAQNEPVIPSQETMRKAMALDLDAAIYFLHALKENPDVIDDICKKLHDRYAKSAALIDSMPSSQLKAQKDGTN